MVDEQINEMRYTYTMEYCLTIENELWIHATRWERKRGVNAYKSKVSFRGNENVLKFDNDRGCSNSVDMLKTTGLYTLKWWFSWYANHISIKPLKNPNP